MDVCARLSVYVRPCKVNWRSALTLQSQTWRHSNVGKAAVVSLSHSPALSLSLYSSSSSSSSLQCYCSSCADNMQGAMWCGSVLSSGLSTVGAGRNVGSEHILAAEKSISF